MSNDFQADEFFMSKAYEQALLAYDLGEVPIGAVLVKDNEIIAKDYNKTITLNDPTAHAETLVIRAAAEILGNYRLVDTKLYVTLEPCIMCVGALVQARVKELVYACDDTRVGVLSRESLHVNSNLNHNLNVVSGVMAKECGELLKKFFKERRK